MPTVDENRSAPSERLTFDEIELLVRAFREPPATYPLIPPRNIFDQVWNLMESLIEEPREWLIALFLNAKGAILSVETLAVGDTDSVDSPPGKLGRRAIQLKAAGFILVHNHPAGNCQPSDGDFRFTRRILLLAEGIDIPLLEHFVIARDGMRRILWDAGDSRYEKGRGFLPDPIASYPARDADDAYWNDPVMQPSPSIANDSGRPASLARRMHAGLRRLKRGSSLR